MASDTSHAAAKSAVPISVITAPGGTSAYQLTYIPTPPHTAPSRGDTHNMVVIELVTRRVVAAGSS